MNTSPCLLIRSKELIDFPRRDLSVNQVVCLYFMGLTVSNEQIAQELALHVSDVQQMTTQLRDGMVKKSPQ